MVQAGHNCEMYNVGAMLPWMDYMPRTLYEIWEGANSFYIRRMGGREAYEGK